MAEQRAEDEPEPGEVDLRTDSLDAEGLAELSRSIIVQNALEDLLSGHFSLPDELPELLQRLRSTFEQPDDGVPAHEQSAATSAAAAASAETELVEDRESIIVDLRRFTQDLATDNARLQKENSDLERDNARLRASQADGASSSVAVYCEGIVLPPLGLPEEAELQLQYLSSLGSLSMHHNWGH